MDAKSYVLPVATFRVAEWAGEKNPLVAVFFLGQKSTSVRVPVRLSPTRLRDKDGRKTALARFDDAYPVDSASATFTPQRPPPYHKEGTDVFPGRIFSCGASSKGGWRQCLLRSKNA